MAKACRKVYHVLGGRLETFTPNLRNGRPLHGTLHPGGEHDASAHALASPRRASGTMPLKRIATVPWETYYEYLDATATL